MVSSSLPSPPADDHKSTLSRKTTSSGTKSVKPTHRTSKRASSGAAAVHHHDQVTHSAGMDGRHKRVWKACERCRMKKTKCDGEFPCKRCKDDGLVCTAGVRKKMEYKQLPRGYAEVLENTQFALIATVHKLYSMVRNNQQWDLGEPELNDRGQPVIHNIAQKLGCIRPNSDIDLPVHSVFPEDEAGMAELARQLEEQQHETELKQEPKESPSHESPIYNRTDRASSSELDHSDIEFDYRRAAFGGHNNNNNNPLTMSPQSFAGSADFEFSNSTPAELNTSAPMFATQSPIMPNFSDWTLKAQQPDDMTMHLLQQAGLLHNMDSLGRGLMDATDFGTIKPNVLSPCANPGVMMGMGDPMIYSGYEDDSMRL
ncbi:Fluconazole resistance protein 1 [Cladobotryum mycophilum]|uniref:Fluconazole resistance protein 1 n=1 Tax=Cladobotryum mycophilum TaxID=491253 RepID=A0ABR0ST75_9HYPO